LLVSEESVPKEITTLLDMRMNATQLAGSLQGLLEQREQLERRISETLALLRSSVRLFDKTLAIVVENHGAEWVANQGFENVSLAAQDALFVQLGAYGDEDGPIDEYVQSQLRA
jgi:hypothetical protein